MTEYHYKTPLTDPPVLEICEPGWCACPGPLGGDPLCNCRMRAVAEGWGVPLLPRPLGGPPPHSSLLGFSQERVPLA